MKALMTVLVVLLLGVPAVGTAQSSDGVPVIAPEMEKVVQQMLGTSLPAGWRLERAQILQASVQVSYSGPKGALARVSLTHKSAPVAKGAAAVGPFAWVPDPKTPVTGALAAAVKKGIKSKAKAFKWTTTEHGPLEPAAAASGTAQSDDRTAAPAPSRLGRAVAAPSVAGPAAGPGQGAATGPAAQAAPMGQATQAAPVGQGAPAPLGAQGTLAAGAGAPVGAGAMAPGMPVQGQASQHVPANAVPPDPLALSGDEQNLVRKIEALRTVCSEVSDDKTRGAAIAKAVESKDTHPWALVVAAAGLTEIKDSEGAQALYARALDEVESRMSKLTGTESTIAQRTRIAAMFGADKKVEAIAALKDALTDDIRAPSPPPRAGGPAGGAAGAPGAAGAGLGAIAAPAAAAAAGGASPCGTCGTTGYSLGDILGTSAFIAVIAFAGAALVRRRRD